MSVLYTVAMSAAASVAQRVRAAITLLDVGGFTSSETKLTSFFSESEDAGEREAG